MAKQRYIQDSFWTDPYIEKLDPSEKLLFLYYLTNPLCNIAGIYEIRNNRVAYETGFDKDMIDRIKNRFVKDGKMLIIDDWILLVNFAKNQNLNPNVKEGMRRIIKELPDKVKALKGFERLSHFTLLNLTLPNSTKPGGDQVVQPPQNETEDLGELSKQIPEVIKAMESIDPKNKLYYGNKTQRGACEFLIQEYGLEKVLQAVKVIPILKTKVSYFPSITTPVELRDKWVKVNDAIVREGVNRAKNTPDVAWG